VKGRSFAPIAIIQARHAMTEAEPTTSKAAAHGVVLAGTHPWTNSTFDRLLPRTLLPVAHRPLLSYALSWLHDGGIADIAVCANRETRALRIEVPRHAPAGVTIRYVEDVMPRGAAGAVRDAADGVTGNVFVVVDGTVVPTICLSDLLRAHESSGAAATIVVHEESGSTGNACLQVPSGVYVFSRRALERVPVRGFFDIKEHLIPGLHKSGELVAAFTAPSASPRVLDAATYLALNEWTVERIASMNGGLPGCLDGYLKRGSCVVHNDALIADDSSLIGPVLVGPGVRIMSGAVVVGPASIGREVVIGRGALLSRSTIWRRSVIGEHAVADRCLMTDDTVLDSNVHVFRSVIANDVRTSHHIRATGTAPQTRSLELARRMRRAVIDAT
jgi:NDP-sugar pyrophosphorylase family protein